jgi:hypothetical protein
VGGVVVVSGDDDDDALGKSSVAWVELDDGVAPTF